MDLKETKFGNEVFLLKQSFHRISKRLTLLETFIKNKFGYEFMWFLSKANTTRHSGMRNNLLRMTGKARSGSPSVKVNSKPTSTFPLSRPNKSFPTAADFSLMLNEGQTTQSGSTNLTSSAKKSQDLKEVPEGQSQTQILEVDKEEGRMGGEGRSMNRESSSDNDDVPVYLMDVDDNFHSSDNSDTEPDEGTTKTEIIVKPCSPGYQPEYEEESDELDNSDTEFLPDKPKENKGKCIRGRKPRKKDDFEYPMDRKCPICDKQWKDSPGWKRDLRVHIEDHSLPKSFACDQCSKAYKRKKRLNYHKKLCLGHDHELERHINKDSNQIKSNDRDNFKFKCNWCDKKFSKLHHKTRHELIHTKKRVSIYKGKPDDFEYPMDRKCPICDKQWKDTSFWKKDFRVHIEDHTLPKSFACDQCSKAYKRERRLNYHKKLCHNQEQHFRFKCNWCDKKFVELSFRATHELVHTRERAFMCDICGKSYGQAGALKRHEMKHSATKDFLCSECGKTFNTPWNLKRHKKEVHEYICDEAGNIIPDKPCHICGQKYTTNTKLKDHILRVHEGKRKKINKTRRLKTSGHETDQLTCTTSPSPLHAEITPPSN